MRHKRKQIIIVGDRVITRYGRKKSLLDSITSNVIEKQDTANYSK